MKKITAIFICFALKFSCTFSELCPSNLFEKQDEQYREKLESNFKENDIRKFLENARQGTDADYNLAFSNAKNKDFNLPHFTYNNLPTTLSLFWATGIQTDLYDFSKDVQIGGKGCSQKIFLAMYFLLKVTEETFSIRFILDEQTYQKNKDNFDKLKSLYENRFQIVYVQELKNELNKNLNINIKDSIKSSMEEVMEEIIELSKSGAPVIASDLLRLSAIFIQDNEPFQKRYIYFDIDTLCFLLEGSTISDENNQVEFICGEDQIKLHSYKELEERLSPEENENIRVKEQNDYIHLYFDDESNFENYLTNLLNKIELCSEKDHKLRNYLSYLNSLKLIVSNLEAKSLDEIEKSLDNYLPNIDDMILFREGVLEYFGPKSSVFELFKDAAHTYNWVCTAEWTGLENLPGYLDGLGNPYDHFLQKSIDRSVHYDSLEHNYPFIRFRQYYILMSLLNRYNAPKIKEVLIQKIDAANYYKSKEYRDAIYQLSSLFCDPFIGQLRYIQNIESVLSENYTYYKKYRQNKLVYEHPPIGSNPDDIKMKTDEEKPPICNIFLLKYLNEELGLEDFPFLPFNRSDYISSIINFNCVIHPHFAR